MIGERVFRKRAELGITMDEIAKKAGLSQTAVCSIENGNISVSVHSLVRVCKVIGINVSDVLDGAESIELSSRYERKNKKD